nr:hypothetical protein [Geodermatophilaceae bacterium]
IRLRLTPGTFNLCPADYCELPGMADGVSGRGLPIEAHEPPGEIVKQAKRLDAAAGMDVGGVEYLVSARDGEAYFYAKPTSMTSTRCRASSPTRRTSSASTRTPISQI